MTIHAPTPLEPKFQRADGQIDIVSKARPDGATGLDVLRQKGSSKAVFPRPKAGRLDAVLINTAGGVTGGDRFGISARAAPATQVCITTQAAERIYRATKGAAGRVRTKLIVEDGAQLYWLPQETILFDGCNLERQLDVEIARNATFLMLEPIVFGRAASGERLGACSLRDRVSISQDGRPLYLDAVRLGGTIANVIKRPAVAAGAGAMANLVMVGDAAASCLPALRALLPQTGGASMLGDKTLVMRLLSPDSHALRTVLLPVLTLLTNNAVPKNWRL